MADAQHTLCSGWPGLRPLPSRLVEEAACGWLCLSAVWTLPCCSIPSPAELTAGTSLLGKQQVKPLRAGAPTSRRSPGGASRAAPASSCVVGSLCRCFQARISAVSTARASPEALGGLCSMVPGRGPSLVSGCGLCRSVSASVPNARFLVRGPQPQCYRNEGAGGERAQFRQNQPRGFEKKSKHLSSKCTNVYLSNCLR